MDNTKTMKNRITQASLRKVLTQFHNEEISFGRMVELLNEQATPIIDRSNRSRRSMNTETMTPLELELSNMMAEVESLGASENLTNCVVALDDAKYFLSLHIDSNNNQ